jgi:3-oxoacyl-[acyl-carrier protein] reductase
MAEELGTDLDVVVNMAGGNTDFTHPSGPRADLRQVMMAWRANLDANLLSAVLTTTAETTEPDHDPGREPGPCRSTETRS